jgi:hypothetical protein
MDQELLGGWIVKIIEIEWRRQHRFHGSALLGGRASRHLERLPLPHAVSSLPAPICAP